MMEMMTRQCSPSWQQHNLPPGTLGAKRLKWRTVRSVE